MASTYSNLKLQLMATGENSTTWGNVTNVNLGTAIEEAITGSVDVAFSSANVTLTLTDTNATQSARNLRLNLTGTATAGYSLIVPSIEKVYIVNNGTDGTITVKNAAGTGIAVPTGTTMWVFNDATNVKDVTTYLTTLSLGTALPVASGGTGASTFTSNYVLKGNGTSAMASSVLYDSGSALGVGTTSPSYPLDIVTSANSSSVALRTSNANAGSGAIAVYQQQTTTVTGGMQTSQTATTIGTLTAHPLLFGVNSTEYARVTSTGYFGIGTTAPVTTLDVSGTVRATGSVTPSTGAGVELIYAGGAGSIYSYNRGAATWQPLTVQGSTLTLSTSGSSALYVNASQNIGIGNTSPSTKLSVTGTFSATGTSSIGDGASAATLQINGGAGTGRSTSFLSGGVNRWDVGANSTAESGTNAGSNFVVNRYSDAGTYLNSPIFVDRSTGITTFSTNPVVGSNALGYLDIPFNTQSGSYTLVIGDRGLSVKGASGVTVPQSVFSAGNVVSVTNTSGGSITITQGSGVTMYLAGTATTGNRTLAANGLATILCTAANTFIITGAGLT